MKRNDRPLLAVGPSQNPYLYSRYYHPGVKLEVESSCWMESSSSYGISLSYSSYVRRNKSLRDNNYSSHLLSIHIPLSDSCSTYEKIMRISLYIKGITKAIIDNTYSIKYVIDNTRISQTTIIGAHYKGEEITVQLTYSTNQDNLVGLLDKYKDVIFKLFRRCWKDQSQQFARHETHQRYTKRLSNGSNRKSNSRERQKSVRRKYSKTK